MNTTWPGVPVPPPQARLAEGNSAQFTTVSKENQIVQAITAPVQTRIAAAALYASVYSLVTTGQYDAVRYLADGLSGELLRELNVVMETDLRQLLADARQNGVALPHELFAGDAAKRQDAAADTPTAVPPSVTRAPREPLWMQLVESALVEWLGDRQLVASITDDAECYRELVRQVRAQADEDGIAPVEVLRGLGEACRVRVLGHGRRALWYLIAKVTHPEI